MALLLRIFLLFTILCTGYSIKCYKCESEKLYGCAKDAKPKEYDCGTLLVEHRYFCVYLVAHNIVMNITYAKSYCLAGLKETPVEKVIVPECHRVPGLRIDECRVCDTNLCNVATLPNAFLLAYVPLILLLSLIMKVSLSI